MLRSWVLLTASAMAVPTGAAAQISAGSDYRVSVDVDLVVLDVAVVDDRGRYVRDLSKDNFEVLEEGRPQSVALFRNEDIPVAAGVIVDSSYSMGAKRPETVEAALAFLEGSNPDDDVFVVNFNDRPTLALPDSIPFTAEPELLRAALNRTRIGGRTSLYDAIAQGLEHIGRSRHSRKFLVVFSDGGDNQSRLTLGQVSRLLQESNVTVYTVGLFDANDPDRNPGVLRNLARMSGGQCFLPEGTQRLPAVCQAIAMDIRSRYIVGYSPSVRGKEDQFRSIEVRVRAPGRGRLEARTRTGYRTPRRSSIAVAPGPLHSSLPR